MPKPTPPRGKSRADSLMETLKRTQPAAAAERSAPAETPPCRGREPPRRTGGGRPAQTPAGKRSAIYLNAEDQKILRELAVWFASQGRPINDTLIIRAALRSVAARPDSALLRAYEQARKADRRFKQAAEGGGRISVFTSTAHAFTLPFARGKGHVSGVMCA